MITGWLLGPPPLVVYGALLSLIAGESAALPLPGETSLAGQLFQPALEVDIGRVR